MVVALASLTGCGGARGGPAIPTPRGPVEAYGELSTAPATAVATPATARVAGEVRFLDRPGGEVDLGWVVVGLVPKRSGSAAASRTAGPLVLVSRSEIFDVPLRAVAAGRPIVLANEGPLAHGLFSAALGPAGTIDLPPGTRSAPIPMPALGPIRFYCSLHAEESFVVFGAGASHAAVVAADGTFELGPVEPGRYTLTMWSEPISGPVRDVVVDGYSHSREPVWIDPDLVRRTSAHPPGVPDGELDR